MTFPVLDPQARHRIIGRLNNSPFLLTDKPMLIFHTEVGFERGTEASFSNPNSRPGVGSTFGLGGPADPGLDGVLDQWIGLDRQSGATWDANPYSWSVECSDGGNPSTPLSDKQLDTAVALGVRWAKWLGIPHVRVAQHTHDYGTIGWHRLFPEWNRSNHDCPGTMRETQIASIIIPEINDALAAERTGELNMTPEVQAAFAAVNKKLDDVYRLIVFGDGPDVDPTKNTHANCLAVVRYDIDVLRDQINQIS